MYRRMSLDERISEIFNDVASGAPEEVADEVAEEEGLNAAPVERQSERRRSSAAIMEAVEAEGTFSGVRKAIRNSLRNSARRDSLDAAIDEYIDQEVLDQRRRRVSLDEHIAEIFDAHPDCEPPVGPEGARRRRSLLSSNNGNGDVVKEAWPSRATREAERDPPMSLDLQMESELWERARSVLLLCWWRQRAESRRVAAIEEWRNGLPAAEQQRLVKLYEMGALRATDPLARQMRYVKCTTAARSATPVETIPRVETIPTPSTPTARLTAAAAKARPRRHERRLNSIETAALLALHEQKLLMNKAELSSTHPAPSSHSHSTRKGALTPAMTSPRQRSGRP